MCGISTTNVPYLSSFSPIKTKSKRFPSELRQVESIFLINDKLTLIINYTSTITYFVYIIAKDLQYFNTIILKITCNIY